MNALLACTCDDCRQERADARYEMQVALLTQSVSNDPIDVAEIIEASEPVWLYEAIGHAFVTGDWDFVRNQAAKHVPALIEADVAERIGAAA